MNFFLILLGHFSYLYLSPLKIYNIDVYGGDLFINDFAHVVLSLFCSFGISVDTDVSIDLVHPSLLLYSILLYKHITFYYSIHVLMSFRFLKL